MTTDALALELLVDTVSGRLAARLSDHLAASAAAHASGRPAPPPPAVSASDVTRLWRGLDCADRRIAARAKSVLRLLAPVLIEADPQVGAAYASPPSWSAWQALCAVRDAVARRYFARPHRELVHWFAGVPAGSPFAEVAIPPKLEAWHATGGSVGERDVLAIWTRLSHGVGVGALTIATSELARPRTFAIERGMRATIVIPARIDTPAKMFSVLHELGHALLWLAPEAKQREWPRVVDEAAASYVAREMEHPINAWFDENAAPARERRTLLARTLATIEADPVRASPAIAERPPWALWHDPAMQEVYMAAEALADALPARLTGAEVVAAMRVLADKIDDAV